MFRFAAILLFVAALLLYFLPPSRSEKRFPKEHKTVITVRNYTIRNRKYALVCLAGGVLCLIMGLRKGGGKKPP